MAGEGSLLAAGRGDQELMERFVAEAHRLRGAGDPESRCTAALVHARAAVSRGELAGVAEMVEPVLRIEQVAGELRTAILGVAVDDALRGPDPGKIEGLLEILGALAPVQVTPVRLALRARLEAERAHLMSQAEVAHDHEQEALERLRGAGARPYEVAALLDIARRHDDADALSSARALCAELGATRWLEQIDAGSGVTTQTPA